MGWHRIDPPNPLKVGDRFLAKIEGREILICHLEAGYVALSSRCSHAAWPLTEEPIQGMEIVCTLHGARFDLRDGCPTGGPASKPLAIYPIEVRDGALYVSL